MNISGSPYSLIISPGPVAGNMCVVFEATGQTGLTGGIAGAWQNFTLQLRDVYNNNITNLAQKINLIAQIIGNTYSYSTQAQSTYQGNGLYLIYQLVFTRAASM